MPESQIYYLGELVERKLDEVLQNTEFSLINYIGLTPEEANRINSRRTTKRIT